MSDHVVTLLFVRLWLGQKKMDVAFEFKGEKRMVKFRWRAKGDSNVPPDHWYETAVRELYHAEGERLRGMIGGY